MRRLLGILIVSSGLLGLLLSVGGFLYGSRLIDSAENYLIGTLSGTVDSLDGAERTIVQTITLIDNTVRGLEDIEETLEQTGQTLAETEPIIVSFRTIAVDEVPESLDFATDSLSSLVNALRTIDSTLRLLSDFEVDLPGPLPVINFGLTYDPDTPLQAPLEQVMTNLENVTLELRNLETPLYDTASNILVISDNLVNISANVEAVKQSFSDGRPVLRNLQRSVVRLRDRTEAATTTIPTYADTARLALGLALMWLALSQLTSLYIGWWLVRGQPVD